MQSTEDEGRQDGVGGAKWEAHFKNSGRLLKQWS